MPPTHKYYQVRPDVLLCLPFASWRCKTAGVMDTSRHLTFVPGAGVMARLLKVC
jgi:hypothetical protein